MKIMKTMMKMTKMMGIYPSMISVNGTTMCQKKKGIVPIFFLNILKKKKKKKPLFFNHSINIQYCFLVPILVPISPINSHQGNSKMNILKLWEN